MSILIRGMSGLGDNLHQRPFVRAAAEREDLYLATPWPQLYRDLPSVKCVPSVTTLRTQAKNQARIRASGMRVPAGTPELRLHYGSETMRTGSLHDTLEQLLPLNGAPYVFDAPDFGRSPVTSIAPVAVIRPVTIRREWSAAARNCEPEYIAQSARILANRGYHVVSVADLKEGEEWILGDEPYADQRFHAGELKLEQLMSLIANAALVVTPVGFALHASIAYRTPVVCIAGGRGGHCAPWKENDPRQDQSAVRWLMPDQYCMCDEPAHSCRKTITDFARRFARAVDTLPRIAAAKAAA
jgi:hypothetical protein